MACQREAMKSKWILELENQQEPNGSWGRFHSRDSSVRKRFPTSELAIQRALALGLDKDSQLLKKAVGYMARHLQGQEVWSDPPEKHEGWPVGIRFITAGSLARVDKKHPALDEIWALWAEIVRRAFGSGKYNADVERQAHRELNGITTKNKYLKLWTVYPLLIISATGNSLPADLERALLDWIWNWDGGIYYVNNDRLADFPEIGSRQFWGWLDALEVLSNFDRWRSVAKDAIAWLWKQRNHEGFWDFGPRVPTHYYFPLSDSWRRSLARQIDCSTRILILLRRYYEA